MRHVSTWFFVDNWSFMRQSSVITVPFPRIGLIESTAKREQPPQSAVDLSNMMAWGPESGRNRGGQRPGLTKYSTAQATGSSNRIQDLNHVTSVQTASPSQTQMQIRSIVGCVVADGDVHSLSPTAITEATSGGSALSSSVPVIFSAEMFGVLYFADGVNTKKWTASTNTVSNWTASAGSFPVNSSDYPRLIEAWNGRIVQAGIKSDPHNWFMTAIGAPTDYDYTPTPEVETQASSGNQGPIGKIGDVVMSLCPYSDDLILFGCDHTIYQISGNPAAGGRLDVLSDITGMAFGRPWCRIPDGTLYFFGSRGGFYRLRSDGAIERVSAGRTEKRFSNIDMDASIIRMAWDDEHIGVWVIVTSLDGSPSSHFFYDVRNEGFFPIRFGDNDHNPVAVHTYDGDDPSDRRVLFGGEDGYVRTFYSGSKNDDGTAIDSYVLMGPFVAEAGFLPIVLQEMQAIVDDATDSLSYEIYVGNSAESALVATSGGYLLFEDGLSKLVLEDGSGYLLLEDENNTASPHSTGTFSFDSLGRSASVYPRSRGYAIYVKIYNSTSNESWEMEHLWLKLATVTSSRGRRR